MSPRCPPGGGLVCVAQLLQLISHRVSPFRRIYRQGQSAHERFPPLRSFQPSTTFRPPCRGTAVPVAPVAPPSYMKSARSRVSHHRRILFSFQHTTIRHLQTAGHRRLLSPSPHPCRDSPSQPDPARRLPPAPPRWSGRWTPPPAPGACWPPRAWTASTPPSGSCTW
jgi:hypothetical protein